MNLQVLQAEPIEWKTATNLQKISESPVQLPLYNGGYVTPWGVSFDYSDNLRISPSFFWIPHPPCDTKNPKSFLIKHG